MNKIYKDKKVINIIDEVSNLNYNIKDNQMLIINCFFHSLKDMNISIKQNTNSYLVINYVGYIQHDANIKINVEVSGDNNKSVVNVRSIAENNHGSFDVEVKVNEKTMYNDVIEDLKAINEEGTITFMPTFQIDTNEVNAEHFATVGGFDEKELFYLESKGLSTDVAKDILKKSFINNLFSDEFLILLNSRKEEHE